MFYQAHGKMRRDKTGGARSIYSNTRTAHGEHEGQPSAGGKVTVASHVIWAGDSGDFSCIILIHHTKHYAHVSAHQCISVEGPSTKRTVANV
jgi:hypothetical protein